LLLFPVLHVLGGTYVYENMRFQAFPASGKPGALVYFPSSFSTSKDPLNFAVFIHGFHNCVENCVLPVGQGQNCSVGGPARSSYSLIKQIEAAQTPSILLVPEVEYDMASSNPGLFGTKAGWHNFMTELLGLMVEDELIPATWGSVDAINRMTIFSHSGAYQATALIATIGNVSAVREVVLLDSLYGNIDDFNSWIEEAADNVEFGTNSTLQRRYANVYTDNGGTYDNSVQQANVTTSLLLSLNQSQLLLTDNTYDTLPAADYLEFPVIFKRSELAHDGVPTYYFQQFLQGGPWWQ